MKNEQIQEFFTKVANDEKFKAKVEEFNKKVTAKTISEKDGKDFINKVVLPAAKKLGYKFTIDELATFFNSQDGANLTSLSPEDLENVSGGVFSLVGTLAAAVIGMLGMAAGGAAMTNEFTPQAVLHRQVEQKKEELKTDKTRIPNVIANMLETLNSPEVLWDIDRMDEKTKVSFLAMLDQVCDATTQDNFRDFVIFYTKDKGDGYGIQSVGNTQGAYESKVLHALVRLKQAYHAPEVDSKLTVPELKLIFGDDYAKLAESMPKYRRLVDELFDTMNDELVRWDLRNVSDDQENFVKKFDLVMSAVERDAGGHYSIPWGDAYGSEELDSQKLHALFELKSSIDNQHAGTEPMVEKATLEKIFGDEYENVIEDVSMWRTYINDVVQTLNDPDVDWNLDKLQGDKRKDLVDQLGVIASNVKYVNGATVIPACGIDEGYGANSDEQGILGLLLALDNGATMSQLAPSRSSDAELAYYQVMDDTELPPLAREGIITYLSSDAYRNYPVKNIKAVDKFISERAKNDLELKRDKDAQEAIREYLMSEKAIKLSAEDIEIMDAKQRKWSPRINFEDQKRLLGQDLALNLREDQQNRLQARLDQSAKELADQQEELNTTAETLRQREADIAQTKSSLDDRQDKLDKDEAQLTEDTETLQKNQQFLLEREEKLAQDIEKLEEKHIRRANELSGKNQLDRDEITKNRKEIAQQQRELAKQKSELDAQRETQEAEAQRLANLKAKLEEQKAQIDKTHSILLDWQSRLQTQKTHQDALNQYLEDKIAQEEQLERNAREAADELSNMQDKLAGITRELKRLKDECAQKDSRILTLTRQLATASSTDAPTDLNLVSGFDGLSPLSAEIGMPASNRAQVNVYAKDMEDFM